MVKGNDNDSGIEEMKVDEVETSGESDTRPNDTSSKAAQKSIKK